MNIKDAVFINLLKNDLVKGRKHLRFIKMFTTPHFLYPFEDGTLIEYILDYKKNHILPLSMLNIDWSDERILIYIYSYPESLTEEDLFFKYREYYFIDVMFQVIGNERMDPYFFTKITNKITNHYEEIIEITSRFNPLRITEFGPHLKEIISNLDKEAKMRIFKKYVNKPYTIIGLLRILNNKQEAADIANELGFNDYLNDVFLQHEMRTNTKDGLLIGYNNNTDKLANIEHEELVLKFYELYLNDSNDAVNLKRVCDFFRESINVGNETTLQILEKMIEIKEKNKHFKLKFDPYKSSCAGRREVILNSKQLSPYVTFHEFGHVMHRNNDEMAFPNDDRISKIFFKVRSDLTRLDAALERFTSDYKVKIDNAKLYVKNIVDEEFEKVKNIDYEALMQMIDGLNIKKEYKEKIGNLNIDEKLFYEKKHAILLDENLDSFLRNNYPEMIALSDIFDAFYFGREVALSKLFGHGASYYSNPSKCTAEIVANIVAIKCLPDYEKKKEYIVSFLGEELYNEIESACLSVAGLGENDKTRAV